MKIKLMRAALLASLTVNAALAQQAEPPSAADSDPVKLGWMVGSPPPPPRKRSM